MSDTNEKNLDSLRLTDKNPRTLMAEKGEKLDRTIDEYGPLDGIVMNVNKAVNELVGGNQRTIKFKQNPAAKVVITHRFDKPTATGSVAYGHVEVDGERWPYREVQWDKLKHSKGVIVANQHAGDEDKDLLAERYHEILEIDADALDTLFITEDELSTLQDGWVDHDALSEGEEADVGGDAPKVKRFTITELKQELDKFSAQNMITDNGFTDWLAGKYK